MIKLSNLYFMNDLTIYLGSEIMDFIENVSPPLFINEGLKIGKYQKEFHFNPGPNEFETRMN